MKYKILITGITGLFGSSFLTRTIKDKKFTIFGICRRIVPNRKLKSPKFFSVDITNGKRIINIIKELNPDIILHAASIGSVDYCETHKREAWKVNVEGTRNILRAAKLTGSKLIFFSTNAVYDGNKPPFNEKAIRHPIDYYGMTKVTSEEDIQKSRIPAVIVRLMTMYGWHDKSQRYNPVTWMIDELRKNHKMNVVSDIYNNHLYVGQAVDAVLQIIKLHKWNEIYNIAGKDCISRYQLALKVADIFSLEKKLISPVKSSFFKTIAPRPKNTCFKTTKMEKELKVTPLSIREGLHLMINEK